MNSPSFTSYIAERYGSKVADPAYEAKLILERTFRSGAKLHEFPFGFYTSKKRGDALIVGDLYLIPEVRGKNNQKAGWELFSKIRQEAQDLNVNVIIGFSQHDAEKRELGERAMTTAGFIKSQQTDGMDIYMRGTN